MDPSHKPHQGISASGIVPVDMIDSQPSRLDILVTQFIEKEAQLQMYCAGLERLVDKLTFADRYEQGDYPAFEESHLGKFEATLWQMGETVQRLKQIEVILSKQIG